VDVQTGVRRALRLIALFVDFVHPATVMSRWLRNKFLATAWQMPDDL
jgi:hypothetical protein